MSYYSIGQLSKETGCKVPTIRYYEQSDLLSAPERTEGNQRRYNKNHLATLKFILHARELGFSLSDIRELMGLSQGSVQENHKADEIAVKHLADIEHKISRLKALKVELSTMLSGCQHGEAKTCHVIEVLFDHSLCSGGH
jgi:DNA-binding transcriptional MerR regulator